MEIGQRKYSDQVMLARPKTYFDLIQKVGSKGKYQRNIFWIFFFNWLICSLLLMGTSFLFLNPSNYCDQLGINDAQCDKYVCSLPENKRQEFYTVELNSLAVEFGPFHCEKVYMLNALRMVLYAGTFFGYILIPFVTDNYGRKFSMVASWSLTLLGIFILSLSLNIAMACIGLFLAGFGCESGIRTTMTILGEIVENTLRQKYSTALSISFGIGEILIGLIYFLLKDWREITIGFCLFPGIFQLLLLIFYLEQTPKFLIKKGKEKAIEMLNRIGKINSGQSHLINEQDIDSVIQQDKGSRQIRTPLALCKFKSQRSNYIALSILFFSITFLYFGPLIVISDFNLNIYVAQFVLGISETVAYPICYIFIEKTPRKLSGYVFLGLSALIFFALTFLSPSQDCHGCLQAILQLILVFGARFCICYYFAIVFLFITEMFPLPLRGTSFGMVSIWGAVASTSSQFILTSFVDKNINPMLLFTILAIIAFFSLYFLPQTLGKKLMEMIPQEQNQGQGSQNEKNLHEIQNRLTLQEQKQKTIQKSSQHQENKK